MRPPCQESNLDDRLRRPVLGFHRDRELWRPRGIRPELYGVREVDGVQGRPRSGAKCTRSPRCPARRLRPCSWSSLYFAALRTVPVTCPALHSTGSVFRCPSVERLRRWNRRDWPCSWTSVDCVHSGSPRRISRAPRTGVEPVSLRRQRSCDTRRITRHCVPGSPRHACVPQAGRTCMTRFRKPAPLPFGHGDESGVTYGDRTRLRRFTADPRPRRVTSP
jgi:hypothetical protein